MKMWKKGLSVGVLLGVLGIFLIPSILNYQLPHVETRRLKERKIVRTVMISAKVQPMDVIRFSFDQPVVVAEYFVKKGRSVGRNIPLFQLSKEAGLPQGINGQAIEWEQRKKEIILSLDQLRAAQRQSAGQIMTLEEQVRIKRQLLDEAQSLYELGMVAKRDAEFASMQWESAKRDLATARAEQELTEAGNEVKWNALEAELLEIDCELEIARSMVSGFYLDEEGNAYSEQSGFILNKNAENARIDAGVPVLELAKVDDFRRLEMIGHVSVDDLEYLEIGMPLKIDTDTENRPFNLKVTDISNLVENGMVELTMSMTAEPEGKFAIGTSYTGRVACVLSGDNTYAVPLSAIVEETFDEDEIVNIYYMEKEDGLFYDRYFVRGLRAKTKSIGDKEVLVQIDSKEVDVHTLEIITNPGYQVYKDARVLP